MAFVTATYQHPEAAERALQELLDAGMLPGDISVLMSEETRNRSLTGDPEGDFGKGAVKGGIIGGVLGALIGAAVVIATGGLGAPLFAAGPLIGAATGGAAGLAIGTVAGGLIEAGFSPEEARMLENDARAGGIVVIVRAPDGTEDRVREILQHAGRAVQ